MSAGDTPDSSSPLRRKPRLVSTLLLIAAIAAAVGGFTTFALLKVQYDILHLAQRATGQLLPGIQAEIRTAINLERLRVFGEIVRNSPIPRERREALLAARILAVDTAYEQNLYVKDQTNRVVRIIERIAASRAEQDHLAPNAPIPTTPFSDIQTRSDWIEGLLILDNLVQRLSTGAVMTVSSGSAQIAVYAERAMLVVIVGLGGLLPLFIITIYFIQQWVVKPILRVTAGLEQVRATQGIVQMQSERLQELDDIASSVGIFGMALCQINERTAQLEREVLERQQAQARLVELATTDSLTGLHNRRYFMETATQEFERARRYRMPLSLLMIDADRFKLINDRYGHHIGDEVLKVLAMIGRLQLREIDLLARLGGEEFAILLPQTDFVNARVAAERLRQAIADRVVNTEQGVIKFTVSLGLAALGPRTIDLDDLLRQADAALYQAKQNGRNRVEPTLPG